MKTKKTKLVLATRNAGKIEEMRKILAEKFKLSSIGDYENIPEIEEKYNSFAQNAIEKATAVARFTGELTIADDSGLEVDALNGKPGVYSARYAGENASDSDRVEKLLNELDKIPTAQRTARFVCAMAICTPDGNSEVIEGICDGTISDEKSGSEGFGYDPIFVPNGEKRTFAALGIDRKNLISHRAKALEKTVTLLEKYR